MVTVLPWKEQIKCRGLCGQPNNRVVPKSCSIKLIHYENSSMQYSILGGCKNENIHWIFLYIYISFFFAQTIDVGTRYTSVYYIKLDMRGMHYPDMF